MKVIHTIGETKSWLSAQKSAGATTGFVPTMGALHEGHIELVRRSSRENDLSVCSIFVNPIQFNNPEDLEKYPRTLETDIPMLREAGCHMVFAPSAKEIYPEPVTEQYDFGALERVMEGEHRPGHFNGVAVVVKRLFGIIEPDRAYFGEKDYQQFRIIQALAAGMSPAPVIVPCPTVREADGLAMSSRNRRLGAEERALAPMIYLTLIVVKSRAGKVPVAELESWATDRLATAGFNVEYFKIAHAATLQPLENWEPGERVRAFTACWLGNVRLIDNMELIF